MYMLSELNHKFFIFYFFGKVSNPIFFNYLELLILWIIG